MVTPPPSVCTPIVCGCAMPRRPVVYFLAPQVAQSSYWAKQLGFKANEWRHIGRTQDAHGIGPSATVYLVGTWYTSVEIEDILRYFNALNIDCILAEDMVPGERM